MGRKRKESGALEIATAEERFLQSEAEGKPDYRLLALAIGEHPFSPPAWAMLACIELRGQVHRAATRGYDCPSSPNAMRNILDEIVRFYLKAEQSHFAARRKREEAERSQEAEGVTSAQQEGALAMDYKAPSFRQAVIAACKSLGVRLEAIGDADDDWHKDVRRAWDYEQHHDALRPKIAGSGPPTSDETYYELQGWKATRRIARVIEEVTALECDFPENIEKTLWISRELAKRENS